MQAVSIYDFQESSAVREIAPSQTGDLLHIRRDSAGVLGQQPDLGNHQPIPTEQQIRIWKDEIRGLRKQDRKTRYEMGKRLAAIQAARAKARVGTFTTVDLPELKIPLHTAYRRITFYKRVQAKIDAELLQFAKDSERFPGVEDVEDYEKRIADAEIDALTQVMEAEAIRIGEMKKAASNHAHDYRITIQFTSLRQLEIFKEKWLGMAPNVRSKRIRKAVSNA